MKVSEEDSFQVFDLESSWIDTDERRLNASSYSVGSIQARNLIEKVAKSGFELDTLDKFSQKIFVGARSKRLFTSKDEGIPYLMPIDLFMLKLRPRKWVKKETRDLENWWVKRQTILITQSGVPGRTLIANELFEDKVVSPNVVRFVPNKKGLAKVGYIYAYLSSWIGQALLTKDQYGATVKHIEPHHVAAIPLPLVAELENCINQRILESHKLRKESQLLLLKAEESLYSELELPKIDERTIEYFGGTEGKGAKSFCVKESELNLRFDASYHHPIIRKIERNLAETSFDVKFLGEKIKSIFIPPRFKRPYVRNPDNGVRYLRPSDLPVVKYLERRSLATVFMNSELYRLKKGDILVVTDGTIGWVSIVTSVINGWYGSNNFARIVPTKDLDRGYLLAFLLSPYGQHQLKREIFGGVIDHLIEDHIRQVKIPIPPDSVQKKIGKLMTKAFFFKHEANRIEDEAIRQLEKKLEQCAQS